MTQINTIAAPRYAADALPENNRSYRERNWQISRKTLPYIVLLAALGLTSAVAAIANPLTFADIFSAM
jgi:hypothetical protein